EDGTKQLGRPYATITDGLSNTLILGEVAGGNDYWARGVKLADASSSTYPTAAVTAYLTAAVAKGEIPSVASSRTAGIPNYGHGWADFQHGDWDFRGCFPDGLYNQTGAASSVFINGSNYNGASLYSFHPGGVNVLLCDGTVRFLNQNMDVVTLT